MLCSKGDRICPEKKLVNKLADSLISFNCQEVILSVSYLGIIIFGSVSHILILQRTWASALLMTFTPFIVISECGFSL